MPHLRYNGRLWRLSSDELFVPGMFAITVRVFWSTLLIIILSYSVQRLLRCPDGSGVVTYLCLTLAVSFFSILCEVGVVRKSLIGSIAEASKREVGIQNYFTAHIILGCMQFILAIYGIFIISAHSFIPCSSSFKNSKSFDLVLLSVTVITQLVDISSLVCCCYTFSANEESEEYSEDYDAAATVWEERCMSGIKFLQICSCNIFGGGNVGEDLKAVSRVLTNFFHHDGFLDVVPSDVVAGIILVRAMQRAKKKVESGTGSSSSSGSALGPGPGPVKFDFIPPLSGPSSEYAATPMCDAMFTADDDETFGECIEYEENDTGTPLNSNSTLNLDSTRLPSPYSVICRKDLDITNEIDRDIVEAAASYAVYMIAIYTHLMVMYTQPCSGVWCLCYSAARRGAGRERERGRGRGSGCQCCPGYENSNSNRNSNENVGPGSMSPYSAVVKGDNMFGANLSGLTHFTRNVRSEVVYVSFDNTTIAKPFAVFLNHTQQSVVVSIRGSLSLEDGITDTIADPVELKIAGKKWGFDGNGRYAHGGFLMAAISVREEIEQSQVLHKIFQHGNGSGSSSGSGSQPEQSNSHPTDHGSDTDLEECKRDNHNQNNNVSRYDINTLFELFHMISTCCLNYLICCCHACITTREVQLYGTMSDEENTTLTLILTLSSPFLTFSFSPSTPP